MDTTSLQQSPSLSAIDGESSNQWSINLEQQEPSWKMSIVKLIRAIDDLSKSQATNEIRLSAAYIESLESRLRDKEDLLARSHRDSCAKDGNHKVIIRDILASFHTSQTEAESKERTYQSQLEALEIRYADSEKKLAASKLDNTYLREEIDMLRAEAQKQEEARIKCEQLVESLKAQVTDGDGQIRMLHNDLLTCQTEAEKIQKSRDELEAEATDLTAKFDRVEGDLKRFMNYIKALSKVNIDECATELEAIWSSLKDVVYTTLMDDIPESCLMDPEPWDKLKSAVDSTSELPLFPSNSPEAKKMRIAAVLGLAAKSIDAHIFSPSYLFEEDDGMRRTLAVEAMINGERERFLRGLLLTISEERDIQGSTRIDQVVREIVWPVASIVTSVQEENLRSKIRPIVSRAMRAWCRVQRSEQKFESSVELELIKGHGHPKPLFLELDGPSSSASTQDQDAQESVLVVFPSVFQLAPEGFHCVYHGYTLHKEQVNGALAEAKKIRKMAQTNTKSIPNRPRRSSLGARAHRSPLASLLNNF